MENELVSKRGLIILLVMATVVIFIGVIWLIARYLPLNLLGIDKPTSTPSQLVMENCTYPVAYWREHPELFPPQVIIGGSVYQERELEALLAHESQDPVEQLKTQLAVAFLNNLYGADQKTIEATLFEAYGWLVQHPAGSLLNDTDRAAGIQFLSELEAYNLGLGGVKPCNAGLSITPTPMATTLVISLTPSPSVTPTASPTLTEVITVTPTRTPIPTTQRPRAATNTPTQPAPPAPSNTPVPSPTRTPEPPTYTFTPPPSPTITFTPPP